MARIMFRPLPVWTDPVTEGRTSHNFKALWSDTTELLRSEVDALNGRWDDVDIVLQVDAAEGNMRRDGGIRADAKVQSPGVVVSFDSKHGPLRYACDTFEAQWYGRMPSWQANVRAIALGLEALRKVSRYGIGQSGEQYTGWAQLPAGRPMGPAMTVEEAARFMAEHGPIDLSDAIRSPEAVAAAYRYAAKRLHPDVGGDPELFRRLNDARELLLGTDRGSTGG